MSTLQTQSFVFDPRPNYPLVSTVKRYWRPNSPYLADADAFTLIFVHGTNFHKEIWEPTIDDLFAMKGGKIRDVWAIDAPNHGDAAMLNEEILQWGYETFRWEEYARLLHAFLLGLGTGVDVNFRKRRLIGVGHSSGAGALLLTLSLFPRIRFESLVLVEIMIMDQASSQAAQEAFLKGATKREDQWPSREAAYLSLRSKRTWKAWDDRVLQSFVCYGLKNLPNVHDGDDLMASGGVTLKCSRQMELAYYRDHLGNARAYQGLSHFAKMVPLHFVYGSTNDYIPGRVKDDVINNATGGLSNLASVSYVEGAGHLLPQTHPTALAERLNDILIRIPSRMYVEAKL
ncbi:alpha/beta-hydrolase [Hymenopellis radicata]|nr:alpha/beta-hydrolase [Hymenopellis radicata]